MPSALGKIVKLLPELSQPELASLQGRLKALMQFGGSAPVELLPYRDEVDESWILQTICDTLRGLGEGRTSISRLKATDGIATFREKLPELLDYFEQVDRKRIYRQSLLMVGIKMLHVDLRLLRLPISAGMILRHIHRIPEMFELHFPGYARNGHLGWIVRRAVNKKESKNVRQESSDEARQGRRSDVAGRERKSVADHSR